MRYSRGRCKHVKYITQGILERLGAVLPAVRATPASYVAGAPAEAAMLSS
jgi:hypothetical protein